MRIFSAPLSWHFVKPYIGTQEGDIFQIKLLFWWQGPFNSWIHFSAFQIFNKDLDI